MNIDKWTVGLAAAGMLTLPSLLRAEEKLSPVLTALSSTTISGYVSTSAQWNPGTGNANPPKIPFQNGKQDGFNLDVVKLSLEKPLDETAWAAGYKVDLFLGPDANALANQSTLSTGAGDFAVKQAYVDLKAPVGNGIEFKLGVFDTLMGFEVTDAPSDYNYTRSYGYLLEPTTHTGLMASYQLSSSWSISAGVVNTFGPQINARAHPMPQLPAANNLGTKAESYKAYMGALAFTAPDSLGFLKGSTLNLVVMNGFNSSSPATGARADQTSLYGGGLLNTPITALKVGVAADYVFVAHQALTGGQAADAQAYGLYLLYQITSKLSFNARGEYALCDAPAVLGATKVVEATGTLQYDLWKNVLTRLEFRWDHAADGSSAFGGQFAPTSRNAFLLAANVVYKF